MSWIPTFTTVPPPTAAKSHDTGPDVLLIELLGGVPRILQLLADQGMGQTLLTVPRESDIPPALTELARWYISDGVVTDDARRLLASRAGAA